MDQDQDQATAPSIWAPHRSLNLQPCWWGPTGTQGCQFLPSPTSGRPLPSPPAPPPGRRRSTPLRRLPAPRHPKASVGPRHPSSPPGRGSPRPPDPHPSPPPPRDVGAEGEGRRPPPGRGGGGRKTKVASCSSPRPRRGAPAPSSPPQAWAFWGGKDPPSAVGSSPESVPPGSRRHRLLSARARAPEPRLCCCPKGVPPGPRPHRLLPRTGPSRTPSPPAPP